MKNDMIYAAIVAFCLGVLITVIIDSTLYRHFYEVIKVTTGEFIIHDGKMYAVYEMERNVKGELQVGIR
jgi:hypothetical protein